MNNMNSAAGVTGSGRSGETGRTVLAERRAAAKPYAVWLYIWGLEWLLSAMISFFDPGDAYGAWRVGVLLAAVAATAAVWLRRSKNADKPSVRHTAPLSAAMPVLACTLIAAVLLRTGVVSPLYMPLLKGIVLAAAYGVLSVKLGTPLLYMGLWMLALTFTVAYAYLGYASVLLGGFGGLSLLTLGLLLNFWHTLWKRRMG
ncbi:hypothetical protein ACFQI7_28370 [Paenibacillus allorhizosphaerae]|uniref:Uncharacterized protein n=1 Tax=Paenibacillus allorhizosphaerae TaxID=2849866 RepID=A0ABM8VMC4_9BACL|nr:hypothetical protein [Paenibacillus allorhizosphaerae]CAG7649802.1 hypothetical protein PAECIP111802_04559 [Paenibacillus allorhizosphaerae]